MAKRHTMKKIQEPAPTPVHIPEKTSAGRQITASLIVISFLVIGTVFAVIYGRGYRLLLKGNVPQISKTGILNITSIPTNAQVYVDGHLATATNSSINLSPKKYTIRVSKDGYNDWQKDFEVKAEEVSGSEALLFPKSPTLQSISTFGVEQALIDPSGTKLAFKIASQSARKNGIYVFDMTARSLPILQGQSNANQIVDDTVDKFSEATISWSPDSKQLLASISAQTEIVPDDESANLPQSTVATAERQSTGLSTYYLLDSGRLNDIPQDITTTISEIDETWKSQLVGRDKARIKSLKSKVAKFANDNFKILAWSPDDKNILYQASVSAQMPVFLTPRRIGNNQLYERRDLKKGAIYVYDTTEDLNTRIIDTIDENSALQNLFTWFPDSEHLVLVEDKKIKIVEKDGSNMTTVYGGPFIDKYVFAWPDGSKIVILTNLGNPSVSPTLYTVGLK